MGIILYKMLTNRCLYKLPDSTEDHRFNIIEENQIDSYVSMNHLQKHVPLKVIRLLNGMLNLDENKRFSVSQILKSQWFASYYKKFFIDIAVEKKSNFQKIGQLKKFN